MPSKRKRSTPAAIEDVLDAATATVLALSEPPPGFPASRRVSNRTSTRKKIQYVDTKTDGDSGKQAKEDDLGSPLTDLEDPDEDTEKSPSRGKKKQRRRKPQEPAVYDIPDVEKKQTNFTGRLGYACLNTILRALKPEPTFCSRTCRLDTIRKNGIEFAKDLGLKNVRDLCKVIEWNEQNRIRFFRVSSEMFPFASHGMHGYDLEYAKDELKAAGDLAKKYGHRLTTHPGQFTQLASPKDNVVTASVRELEYHCQMMRYMGLGRDSVIIIHMGGVYGDKETTITRFKGNYRTRLTDEMKARLVLENDEMCYSPDDLLPVCNELGIPMVLDYHHNWINPSARSLSELLPLVADAWIRKGIRQKQHLSEPRPGAETVMEKRAHADRCVELPDVLTGGDVDLMIEAKDKEQAVFHLYRIYGLEPVIHENLRPEKPPKPFVRSKSRTGQEDEDALDDGGDLPGLVDETPTKRTRRRATPSPEKRSPRKRRKGLEETPVGDASPTPSSPKSTQRARRRAKGLVDANESGRDGNDEFHSPSGPAIQQNTKTNVKHQKARALVDGASIVVVEADAHPEAASVTETASDEAKQCKEE